MNNSTFLFFSRRVGGKLHLSIENNILIIFFPDVPKTVLSLAWGSISLSHPHDWFVTKINDISPLISFVQIMSFFGSFFLHRI